RVPPRHRAGVAVGGQGDGVQHRAGRGVPDVEPAGRQPVADEDQATGGRGGSERLGEAALPGDGPAGGDERMHARLLHQLVARVGHRLAAEGAGGLEAAEIAERGGAVDAPRSAVVRSAGDEAAGEAAEDDVGRPDQVTGEVEPVVRAILASNSEEWTPGVTDGVVVRGGTDVPVARGITATMDGVESRWDEAPHDPSG